MIGLTEDTYWTDEFAVTVADLERMAEHMRQTGQAHDLMALARRVVRGRLRHGPESSAVARRESEQQSSVRLWDPAGEWRRGDHVIVVKLAGTNRFEPRIAEVIGARRSKSIVDVMLTDTGETAMYQTALAGSRKARRWRQTVERAVEAKRRAKAEAEQVGAIILGHGERIASQLLDALRADERFVRLAGRWFVRELAKRPGDEQMAALAWAMVSREEPAATSDLVGLVPEPFADGDPGLFGLYLALRERPEVFGNAAPGQVPHWELVGPPPGSCTAANAAYDPETFEILCAPGEVAEAEAVGRLWELGLLPAVVRD